eukprot:CAMPEP_0177773008 /NCGR_PEP_ID=MMETSP0491_2-20121128/12587_1 /TAXON_ID=63592 /ORGANISM="Tetraselmis chuii, Strain PLY429" /LENGTH=58 /DNA_ID=CAMNT_0019290977 /DNA_START=193 /DNA_END=369 /DNA_ORIENTATION=-
MYVTCACFRATLSRFCCAFRLTSSICGGAVMTPSARYCATMVPTCTLRRPSTGLGFCL